MSEAINLEHEQALRLRCLELAVQAGGSDNADAIAASFAAYVLGDEPEPQMTAEERAHWDQGFMREYATEADSASLDMGLLKNARGALDAAGVSSPFTVGGRSPLDPPYAPWPQYGPQGLPSGPLLLICGNLRWTYYRGHWSRD